MQIRRARKLNYLGMLSAVLVGMILLGATVTAAVESPQLEGCGFFGDLQPGAVSNCAGRHLTGGLSPGVDGCPKEFDPTRSLKFDDDLHARWYARFWTGRCDGLGLFDFCTEEAGGWNDTVAAVAARVPPEDRNRARAELWAIGRLLGYEWARRNDIRKISTADLMEWRPAFEKEPDPWLAMRTLCVKAIGKLQTEARSK